MTRGKPCECAFQTGGVFVRRIHLVDNQEEPVGEGTQPVHEVLILGSGFSGIQHKDGKVRSPRGSDAALRHHPVEGFPAGGESARIHQEEGNAAEGAGLLHRVPRHARGGSA